PGWSAIIAKLDFLNAGFFDEWTIAEGDLTTLWAAVFASSKAREVSPELRRTCFEAAAEYRQTPARVRIGDELVALDQCYVTTSDALAVYAHAAGVPVVVLSVASIALWSKHGAKNLSDLACVEHGGRAAEPVSLLDVAPELAPVLPDDFRD